MFVMLLGSFTYAQTDGNNFDFSCIDYVQLRADRVADVEALGNTEVFALLAIQEDPAETTTIIFNKQLTAYVNTVYSHIERWEQSDYDAYLTDLEDKVNDQIARNERIVILEAAFITYSTDIVDIYLIKDDNDNDAILFDGGVFSFDYKFNQLLENISITSLQGAITAVFTNYVNIVENEVKTIIAAALKANEDAFDAAFDSNTATSTLDREIELENLSRDGVFVEITYPSWGGFKEEYKDANGITFLDADGDEQEIRYHNSDLEDLSDADYTLWYNTTVTKVKDLVQRLINN